MALLEDDVNMRITAGKGVQNSSHDSRVDQRCQSLGQKEGQRFAALQPGPSFTSDLVEEFADLIDYFRTPLADLAKQLAQATPRSSGGN